MGHVITLASLMAYLVFDLSANDYGIDVLCSCIMYCSRCPQFVPRLYHVSLIPGQLLVRCTVVCNMYKTGGVTNEQ